MHKGIYILCLTKSLSLHLWTKARVMANKQRPLKGLLFPLFCLSTIFRLFQGGDQVTFCVVEQLATDYKENRDVMTLHMRIRAPFVIALKEKKKKTAATEAFIYFPIIIAG